MALRATISTVGGVKMEIWNPLKGVISCDGMALLRSAGSRFDEFQLKVHVDYKSWWSCNPLPLLQSLVFLMALNSKFGVCQMT